VPGLFAAGECGGGLHGSNRLGGNSLSDLLVFGLRAGLSAAEFAREHQGQPPLNEEAVEHVVAEMYEPFNRDTGENAFVITEALHTTMEHNVGIARQEDELKQSLVDLSDIKGRVRHIKVPGDCRFNPGWHESLSLRNLLICSEAIARCALERKESRGAHMRVDFPSTDAEQGKWNLVIRRGHEGQMELSREPLQKPPAELAALLEDKAS
jgi:succinate dehydrogenase / fumarate reductase flavoprotein subunit